MHNTLTRENIKKLQEELEYRLTVKRAEIAREKMEAAPMVTDQKMQNIKSLR